MTLVSSINLLSWVYKTTDFIVVQDWVLIALLYQRFEYAFPRKLGETLYLNTLKNSI